MPAPKINFTTPEKYWDDAREGDECISPSYTVTKERILAYADLTGDHTPVHVDEAYANASHFGCLVAHGLFGLSIADGLKTQSEYRFLPGMSLGWAWTSVCRSRSTTCCTSSTVWVRCVPLKASRAGASWCCRPS